MKTVRGGPDHVELGQLDTEVLTTEHSTKLCPAATYLTRLAWRCPSRLTGHAHISARSIIGAVYWSNYGTPKPTSHDVRRTDLQLAMVDL